MRPKTIQFRWNYGRITLASHRRISPFETTQDEPAFDAPWQAEVLAIADTLIETGVITQADWARALGAALVKVQVIEEQDDKAAYYSAALQALEQVIADPCGISQAGLDAQKQDWIDAYAATPHGMPVVLKSVD